MSRLGQFVRCSHSSILVPTCGCDHSRFIVVPDWYANGCCHVLALEQTQYSMLNVFIKYMFLKSMLRLRDSKQSFAIWKGSFAIWKGSFAIWKGCFCYLKTEFCYFKQPTPMFLSAIRAIMFHAKTSQTHDIPTKLRYWIPWTWKGHVVVVVPAKNKYADSKSSAYLRGTWLKTKKYQTVILAYLRYVSTRIIAPWTKFIRVQAL
jgi:hypothetical protein